MYVLEYLIVSLLRSKVYGAQFLLSLNIVHFYSVFDPAISKYFRVF